MPSISETREQRQLRLIGEVVQLLAAESIPCWLRGGWAMDFFLSEVTRAHEDIDFFAWSADTEALAALLTSAGFEEIGGPPPTSQRNFIKDGETLHIALLEKTPAGRLITPAGRWHDVHVQAHAPARAAIEEWPVDMLDAPPGRLDDHIVPMISVAAQLRATESAARIPGHALTEKHREDMKRLRNALAADDAAGCSTSIL